jgi:hypothetical protein
MVTGLKDRTLPQGKQNTTKMLQDFKCGAEAKTSSGQEQLCSLGSDSWGRFWGKYSRQDGEQGKFQSNVASTNGLENYTTCFAFYSHKT